jgi:hypothetical protein
MPTSTAYDLDRWESKTPPNPGMIERMMGLEAAGNPVEPCEALAGQQSGELFCEQGLVMCLCTGVLNVTFPGYGVVALAPGDILKIPANTRFEWTAPSGKPATWLCSSPH